MKYTLFFLLLTASLGFAAPELAPNAPIDKPVRGTDAQMTAFERAIAPHVAKARSTYPEAKKRYLAGLPPKHTFFLTTRLHDKTGNFEQVFIAVDSIKDGKVTGTISSDINVVSGYKRGDRYTFPETELLDWPISKPDGTEEGNFVGNFLDTYRQ
ncbi:hypothetical protein ACXR0O_29400 [Verrucomicrobiota bacterium sgz303538]